MDHGLREHVRRGHHDRHGHRVSSYHGHHDHNLNQISTYRGKQYINGLRET